MDLARNRKYFYLDIETEGLLSGSYGRYRRRRSQTTGPRVSEIAWAPDGVIDTRASGYTNLVNNDLLSKHGITKEAGWTAERVMDPRVELPRSLYEDIIGKEGPALWDISVGVEKGAKGEASTLNRVFRQHAAASLRGDKLRTLEDFAGHIVNTLESLPKDQKGVISGWNIASFDIPVMLKQLRGTGVGKRLAKMVSSGSIEIAESARTYHLTAFQHMLENSRYAPAISDMRLIKEAVQRTHKVALDTRLYLRKNIGLRRFVNDIDQAGKGKDAFLKRGLAWADKFKGTPEHSAAVASAKKVALTLAQIKGKDHVEKFEALEKVTGDLQRTHTKHTHYIGSRTYSDYDIVGEIYRPRGQMFKQTHVLGDPSRLVSESLFGKVHGLQFVGGGKLEEVAESLLHAARETKSFSSPKTLETLSEYVTSAHRAAADAPVSALVEKMLEPGPGKEELLQNFRKVHFSPEVVRRRSEATVYKHALDYAVSEGIIDTPAKPRPGIPTAAPAAREPSIFARAAAKWKSLPTKTKWGIGIGVAAALWLSERNKPDRKRIEGIRKPDSENLEMDGVDQSRMPGANVSEFGSGSHRDDVFNPKHARRGERHTGGLTASYLGKNEGSVQPSARMDRMAEAGDFVHKSIEEEFMRQGLLRSFETKIRGFGASSIVDTFLKNGTPLEIKTVENTAMLMALTAPRYKDIGQTNYDILASGGNYGYMLYASREDPSKRKLFRVTPDPSLLMSQMSDLAGQRGSGYRPKLADYAFPYFYHKTIIGRGLGNLEQIFNDTAGELGLGEEDPFADWAVPTYNVNEIPSESFGGYVQNLSETASMSKIRDQNTQLQNVKMVMPRRRGRRSHNYRGHAEGSSSWGL